MGMFTPGGLTTLLLLALILIFGLAVGLMFQTLSELAILWAPSHVPTSTDLLSF